MSAIEQRALAQLAELLKVGGFEGEMRIGREFGKALVAEIAALTPPDGFVLVPACHTPAMDDAGCIALFGSVGGKQSAQVWKCWDAMLAARPEVP